MSNTWRIEDLGRGLTRMRREVNDRCVLLASNDAWCAFDPTVGPPFEVGSNHGSVEGAMKAADEWAKFNVSTWYVVNELEVGEDGFCKVYAGFHLKQEAINYFDSLPHGLKLQSGYVSIKEQVPRLEDLPWIHIPDDGETREHLEDLDNLEKELT